MRLVRGLLTTIFVAGGVAGAAAADYLRGPVAEPAYQAARQTSQGVDWSGFYIGGTASYNFGKYDNEKAGKQLTREAYSNLLLTDKISEIAHIATGHPKGVGYGAFFGYNMMWDDVVIGVEAEYNLANLKNTSYMNPIGRIYTTDDGTLQQGASLNSKSYIKTNLKDYAVLRVRAGASYGIFLPFVSAGLVIANAKSEGRVIGLGREYEKDQNGNWTLSSQWNVDYKRSTNEIELGYALGAGVDVALTQNVFLRGQWEYISFGGEKSPKISVNTFKAGAGVKF